MGIEHALVAAVSDALLKLALTAFFRAQAAHLVSYDLLYTSFNSCADWRKAGESFMPF